MIYEVLLFKCLFPNYILLHMQVLVSAVDSDASLDVLDHPILDFIYYMVFYLVFSFVSCPNYFGVALLM